ncbi:MULTISPECIES: excisionase [unclassified Afipia]|jgi:hypothetical protein|uniref:excisionase n=1 Tax=unclassified Afipia TaxID=2642050 RepID=UPI001FCA7CCF|nr:MULTISPECIES: excisionase [unclassified Afipia]
MTISGLRREAARGRLVIERIAGKHYVTLNAIDRMRELCREERRGPDSGFDPTSETPKEALKERLRGSSSTEASISPRDALRMKLQQQKSSLRPTLPKNTNQLANGSTSKRSLLPT